MICILSGIIEARADESVSTSLVSMHIPRKISVIPALGSNNAPRAIRGDRNNRIREQERTQQTSMAILTFLGAQRREHRCKNLLWESCLRIYQLSLRRFCSMNFNLVFLHILFSNIKYLCNSILHYN